MVFSALAFDRASNSCFYCTLNELHRIMTKFDMHMLGLGGWGVGKAPSPIEANLDSLIKCISLI